VYCLKNLYLVGDMDIGFFLLSNRLQLLVLVPGGCQKCSIPQEEQHIQYGRFQLHKTELCFRSHLRVKHKNGRPTET
jgi:hypothetical protein